MYDMLWEFRQTEFLVAIDDNGIVVHSTHRYSHYGCLFIDKLVNLNTMLSIFKKSLNLLNDMDFKGMENGIVCFTFAYEVDLQKVEDHDSWCFNGHVLLSKHWNPELSPQEMMFHDLFLWVLFLGLPLK